MIACPSVKKSEIRFHYDLSTLFYRLLWGEHIHHGLWDASESPELAQRQLIDRVAGLVDMQPDQRVLDVGCGMGGSSIHLARNYGVQVTGVTLSGLQRRWAQVSSTIRGAGRKTEFLRADAEAVDFPSGAFDVVWSVECTEHLFDKPRFFRRAARWLKPGGRMSICAWLAGDSLGTDEARQKVFDVCEGFLCPSLGTRDEYVQWMTDAGLKVRHVHDWTDQVAETWEICRRRVRRTGMRWLAWPVDRTTVRFLDHFDTILDAYRTRAMGYGCFIAEARG